MITISIINQKGGVGKTTTALNIASYLSNSNKILAIDLDKQGNLSDNLGVTEPSTTIEDLFLKNDFEIVPVKENLDLIPANIDFAGIDLKIQNELSREKILGGALQDCQDKYNYCIIDCPPDINLITINALSTSDHIIIPIKADSFSMKGIDKMLDFIIKVRESINPKLSILGILICQYSENLTISKSILEEIKKNNWQTALFETKIRKNTAVEKSQYYNKSVFDFDPKSSAAIDYTNLCEEIKNKLI